jgi:hypothetical protein
MHLVADILNGHDKICLAILHDRKETIKFGIVARRVDWNRNDAGAQTSTKRRNIFQA